MGLSDEQMAAFQRDGFVIVDDFFTTGQLSEFTAALRRLVQAELRKAGLDPGRYQDREFSTGMAALEDAGHDYVADLYNTAHTMPEFLRLVSKHEFPELVNQILGRQSGAPLYTMTHRCRVDPPRDEVVFADWHQEVLFSAPHSRFVLAWAPLVKDVGKGEGAMEACVGSHRMGIVKQTWSEPEGRHRQLLIDSDIIDAHQQRTLEVRHGQLLLFDPLLIHKSGENLSDRVRFTLIAAYHDVDNPHFRAPKTNYQFQQSMREYYEMQMAEIDQQQPA
jgi:ectoine hydroxylase-related dioxygenase (phytanoyl-CoA dioxygenase family)